jgi:hypothetical protein
MLEPVSDELGDVADDPALRRLLAAAIAAARSGLQLGPLPAGGLGSGRTMRAAAGTSA